jgi:hypothetical protein
MAAVRSASAEGLRLSLGGSYVPTSVKPLLVQLIVHPGRYGCEWYTARTESSAMNALFASLKNTRQLGRVRKAAGASQRPPA